VDEYIASLPAQVAIIGGRTLETLTSLPSVPQPKERASAGIGVSFNNAGVGIGVNTLGGTGFNAVSGILATTSVNTNGTAGASGVADNTAGSIDETGDTDDAADMDNAANNADETADTENVDEAASGAELTPEEQSVVNELRNSDREVRAHEQAHISAGGAYIRGGASYQYQRGPDNKNYAVGGEVGIDATPERDDPGATITKMQAVRAAALAPSDPSAQDRAVAASAAQNESVARADLAEERRSAAAENNGDGFDAPQREEFRNG
jgi:hypothetical protein